MAERDTPAALDIKARAEFNGYYGRAADHLRQRAKETR